MSSTFCPTCSSCAAVPVTSGPTTDLSSSPRLSKLGSPPSAPRLPISSPAVLGRMATSRASTPAFAMSCSMARSSSPSEKLRSSSKAGGVITIRSGRMPRSATSHQHQRCSWRAQHRGQAASPNTFRPRLRNDLLSSYSGDAGHPPIGELLHCPPVGGTFWFQIFIQAPSPEIWSETISGGEEVLAGKWGGLFLRYLLGKNFRRRDRDQLSFRSEAREASGNETPSSEPGAIVPVSGCLPGHPDTLALV